MKTFPLAAATIGAFFAFAPLQAQEPTEADAKIERAAVTDEAAAEDSQRGDEAIVCRDLAPKVGTRIPGRRVCLPIYQWEEWEKTTRETAQDVEMRGRLYAN
ncbi:hypothetical protein [Qipengyuania sp.]|uniref:hypothetical protein n=1 Tax=Qipengyuania sp. TaxID=2004515 RepID=UPI0035190E97